MTCVRLLALMTLLLTASFVEASEELDPFAHPFNVPDLRFPAQPQAFTAGRATMMLKPKGPGPFPGLVIMPTCSGTINGKVWAQGAVDRGYAVLLVDPLTARNVWDNCYVAKPVPMSRLLKDAFDAAEHLRRQPFVDPDRVALLGFSLGGMVGLGAAGEERSYLRGYRPFRAIVSVYPICRIADYVGPSRPEPVDLSFVPKTIVVPLLVEIGDSDDKGGTPMNGCKDLLDEQRDHKAPSDYIIYPAGHAWDMAGYDDVTRQSAMDAFVFLAEHVRAP
jgi:dienelactone hydrolase